MTHERKMAEASSPSNPPTVPPRLPSFPYTPPEVFVLYRQPRDGGDDGSYRLNNTIMITAILSLSFVIVLVVFLHLYARHLMRRHLSNRRVNISILRMIAASASNNNVHEQVPVRSVGMEPWAIAKLPMFGYKRRHENASMECSVCLSVLEDEEVVRMLPGCRHVFHVECVDMWLNSHSTCPVCRADVEVPAEEKGETSTSTEMNKAVDQEGSVSMLSSPFRRMLSWERSGRRVHDVSLPPHDLERQ